MPDVERTKEVVEQELKKTREDLNALIKKINDQGYRDEGDEEKIQELEKEEDKLKNELENLKGGISSDSSEETKETGEFKEMSKEEALQYLSTIKDYSWGQLSPLGRKWIGAVQVVLKNEGYPVGKIDGYLGRRTKSGVRKFQKEHGLGQDGKPGTKTINAILGNSSEKGTSKEASGNETTETQGETTTKKDNEGNTFVGTVDKDGNPLTGTYTMKDGTKYQVKDGNIE